MKGDLKLWNNEIFGHIDKNIERRKQEILMYDTIDDVMGLEEQEVCLRNEAKANL